MTLHFTRYFLFVVFVFFIANNVNGRSSKKYESTKHIAGGDYQQPSTSYKGKITNTVGTPVTGAMVTVVHTAVSTITANDGSFTLNAEAGDSLRITADRYETLNVVITGNTDLSFVLVRITSITNIEAASPVQLIYATSPANLTSASTGAVYHDDLIKSPVTSFRNALTGRLAGLYTIQSSGLPGADGSSLSLRGQGPLVIIDGVVANLTSFDLEEIESVTVVKDALGMAMLGVRSSPGAIVVTTRKGRVDKQQISFTVQTAVQKSIGLPKTLGAYQYASLYNEALANDGLPALYSNADLQGYLNHTDPIKYPDVDWRKEVTEKSSRFNKYTLSATGGNQFARYFVSLEHVNQSGFFKTVDSNKYNTNNNLKAYIIRSNIDVTITNKLTGGIYLLGRLLNSNDPGTTTGNILSSILATPSNAYPVLNANGSFGASQLFQNNILAQTIGSGYQQNYKRDMMTNVYLKRSLDEVAKGMYVQIKTVFYASLSENIVRTKTFAVYSQGVSPTGNITYTQFGTNGVQGNGNGIENQGRADYEEIKIGYDKVIHKDHTINAVVLANRDNAVTGSTLPYTITGISGRVAYNYKGKYTSEFAFGYNGSNRYPDKGDTKRGFFPALGVGWNIEQENFMRSCATISRLKLYASYGKTGWDNPGYFTYIQQYFDAATTYFGTGPTNNTSMSQLRLANRNISWEKANKLNIGLNGALLHNKLEFSVEYYRNKYYDLLQQRGKNSSLLGNLYPDENIGQNRYTGWEAQLGWKETKSALSYFLTGNISLQKSTVLFIDEVPRDYPWMQRTGQMVGQRFGYIADGLFQTKTEADNAPTTVGYTPQAGDIRYKDLNGDKVIDQLDIAPVGTTKPFIFYGVCIGAAWKGFDISALLQGVKNRDIYLGGASYWAFQGNGFGQAYEDNLKRWTPATAGTATYPRLNIGNNSNNQAPSSYWLASGNYWRLKNVELGYSLPASIMDKVKLQSARFFVNGFNLFTKASPALGGRDPEVTSAFSYPAQQLVNLGITIKF